VSRPTVLEQSRDAAAPHPSQGSAIPEELVHELRYLEIFTRREIENLRIGAYVSPYRGVGFDFWEHRRYQIGDDVRRIDWNATARLGQILMKIDHAERELNAVLAVDLSRSMEFTSSALTKRETLLRVAGSLAFSAAADHVHLGMLAFTDKVEAYFPPRQGRLQAWRIVEYLWSARPASQRTNMRVAVQTLAQRLRQTTVVFVLSDFYQCDIGELRELDLLGHHHDVLPILIEDPLEGGLPDARGYVRLRDVESGQERVVDLTPLNRRAYAEHAAARRRELIQHFYRLGLDHVPIEAGQPYVDRLVQAFSARKRRQR
jgi:uncharacterized protein (DUF58 family)